MANKYKTLNDGELLMEAQMQDPRIEPALVAEVKSRGEATNSRFFGFITEFRAMPSEAKPISDHIMCPCWATGEFKWQWECPAHPYDLPTTEASL